MNSEGRWSAMPNIRPISDLRHNAAEIADFCKSTNEPVFITKNGNGEIVVMSVETYERIEARLDVYSKLAEAEAEAATGEAGADFGDFAGQLRGKVHGTI
jgi:prevent-host-death family protein